MPVGAHKPGKHSGLGGAKPTKDKGEEKKVDEKEPESPVKVKASPKPASAEAKQKSKDGKTTDQHLDELRDKVLQAGGPDVKTAGWTCKLVPSAKGEGAAASGSAPLDPCWVEPETGKEFLKRKNVLKHLGLSEPKKLTREEAAQASREKFKELNKDFPLPRKIGDVTVLQWGKVAFERPTFHSSRHIWPIGFKSRWIDESDKEVTYESEIKDGKEQCGAPDDLKDMDAPIFVVRVTRPGEDKPTEFFGKNGKQVWRRATRDEKAKDHTGLKDEEVCTRLEGLKNADKCQNYEFIAMRPPPLPADTDAAASPTKKKKKKKKPSSNGDSASKTKVAGKKRKAEGQPQKESQKAKRAREREEKLQEKAKEKEEKEKKQQAAAEERRLAKEEEARKRKEAKELQEIEQKWLSRYPIEDLALELEAKAMEEAKAAGHDVPAQRAAARAVVDAVERGWGEEAAMAAGKEAAECRANGDTDEEASEKGYLKGESVHEASTASGEVAMDVDDGSTLDNEILWRHGTRVKVLFKTEKGTEQKSPGFVSQRPDDSNKETVDFIDFYNDDEPHQIPKDDPDLEILGQGLLRLPPSMPKPQRAPVHCSDVLTVSRFVDAFKAELKLPKGTLDDFQEGLENPANSEFLNQLYQALLISAMEATLEKQNAIVPAAWLGDNTLTNYTWPEIARRWVTCGPYAEANKHRFPEAVLAATCLSASPGGAKARPEGHLKLLMSLIEDSMDHSDIHSAVERRIEVSEDARKARDDKVKQCDMDLKDARERVKAAEEAVAKVDVGDEGTDVEPVPDEATKGAIEAAKALEVAKAEGDGASAEAIEDEAGCELRTAFEEKHAEWKKRRDERGGKAADKELTAARNQEKKFHDQRIKADTDLSAKLEKFAMRQAPLGMDRFRNKYWWFPADAATLYVEPPMPSSGKDFPDPSNYSLEWRMWIGSEAMTKVAECLCDKGVRESELKAGILKIVEKLDAEQFKSTVRPQLKLQESSDDQLKFYDSFQFAHQETKNIHEVFTAEQQRILSKELPEWEAIMENPLDCDQMAKLLLNLEHAVDESLAHTKRTKGNAAASRSRADAAAASAAQNGGSDAGGDVSGANGGSTDLGEEWHRFPHPYIGKRVRRNVMGEDLTHAGKANGVIVGYLPAEISDFKSKQTNLDAALWKLKFEDPDIGNGYEDLEEYEVKQAMLDYDKMQASLQSAASLRKGIVAVGGEAAESSSADAGAVGEEIEYDEGAIDMAEASNKVTGALWTSKMQQDAWRHEVKQGASSNSVVRMCYSASVLCENVLRVMSKTRNDLSSAPRRTRTERSKRPREVAELAAFSGFTESGRRVKKVNYAENNHDSDDSD